MSHPRTKMLSCHVPMPCATGTVRVAHAGRTYRMVIFRLPCTGSQYIVDAVVHARDGCRCSAVASLAVWALMLRCCVSRGVRFVRQCCVHVCLYSRSPQANVEKPFPMISVMLVPELGVLRRFRAVPISVACKKHWRFCGDIHLTQYM